MKIIIFKFVGLGVLLLSFTGCGVKGRPEPPLRPPLETSSSAAPVEPLKPVTFSTDKGAVPTAAPSKTKTNSTKKKNGN
ncbi:MAG: hypothetical protein K2Q26_09350 [Bdellovibrionales bacterium]|nr:hypothetical protein [Bdellovibrionales bacterium]